MVRAHVEEFTGRHRTASTVEIVAKPLAPEKAAEAAVAVSVGSGGNGKSLIG